MQTLLTWIFIGFMSFSTPSFAGEEGGGGGPAQENQNQGDDKVKCYGIADRGQNENVIHPSIDGHVYGLGEAPPCHPEAYISLPRGTDCSKIIVGQDGNLNYVRGSGSPDFNRPQVEYCYPYDLQSQNPTFPNPDWKREVRRN